MWLRIYNLNTQNTNVNSINAYKHKNIIIYFIIKQLLLKELSLTCFKLTILNVRVWVFLLRTCIMFDNETQIQYFAYTLFGDFAIIYITFLFLFSEMAHLLITKLLKPVLSNIEAAITEIEDLRSRYNYCSTIVCFNWTHFEWIGRYLLQIDVDTLSKNISNRAMGKNK